MQHVACRGVWFVFGVSKRSGLSLRVLLLGLEGNKYSVLRFGSTSDEKYFSTTQSDQQKRYFSSFSIIVGFVAVARVPSNMLINCVFGWMLTPTNGTTVPPLRRCDSVCTKQCKGGEAGARVHVWTSNSGILEYSLFSAVNTPGYPDVRGIATTQKITGGLRTVYHHTSETLLPGWLTRAQELGSQLSHILTLINMRLPGSTLAVRYSFKRMNKSYGVSREIGDCDAFIHCKPL